MKIFVIGTGNVGSTLAKRLRDLGHEVLLNNESGEVPESFSKSDLTLDVSGGVAASEIIIFAVPFDALQGIINKVENWENKVIIDATNPLASDLRSMSVGNTISGAEKVAEWTNSKKVVKAFNTTGWENMLDPRFGNDNATMFAAGDDPEAKSLVLDLIKDLGFDPFDSGQLFMSRFLEPMSMVWIQPARIEGKGPGFAFKIIRR